MTFILIVFSIEMSKELVRFTRIIAVAKPVECMTLVYIRLRFSAECTQRFNEAQRACVEPTSFNKQIFLFKIIFIIFWVHSFFATKKTGLAFA